MGTDNDKRIKSTDSIGACSYGTMYKTDEIGKICKKGEIKSNSKIKHYKKWFTMAFVTKENINKHT